MQSTVTEPETPDETEQEPETPDTDQDDTPEPETEEPAAQPDLTITITVVSPASVQSGDTVALQVRVQNKGTAPASQEAVSFTDTRQRQQTQRLAVCRFEKPLPAKSLHQMLPSEVRFAVPHQRCRQPNSITTTPVLTPQMMSKTPTTTARHRCKVTVQPKATPPTETGRRQNKNRKSQQGTQTSR